MGTEIETEELYYYRARYYDAGTQRFISLDPIGFASGDFNFYRYVGNSPLVWNDPFGLMIFVAEAQGSKTNIRTNQTPDPISIQLYDVTAYNYTNIDAYKAAKDNGELEGGEFVGSMSFQAEHPKIRSKGTSYGKGKELVSGAIGEDGKFYKIVDTGSGAKYRYGLCETKSKGWNYAGVIKIPGKPNRKFIKFHLGGVSASEGCITLEPRSQEQQFWQDAGNDGKVAQDNYEKYLGNILNQDGKNNDYMYVPAEGETPIVPETHTEQITYQDNISDEGTVPQEDNGDYEQAPINYESSIPTSEPQIEVSYNGDISELNSIDTSTDNEIPMAQMYDENNNPI